LRAFTPRDQKAVKSAATTLRANPNLDVEAAITELGVGEALVSFLDEKGRPCVVERAFVLPPGSRLGAVTPEERAATIKASLLAGAYDNVEDRESAYEKLKQRVQEQQPAAKPGAAAPQGDSDGSLLGALGGLLGGSTGPRGGRREGAIELATKSAARTIGSQVGRAIIRGVLGSILGGGRRR
jgi:hypothetical protein